MALPNALVASEKKAPFYVLTRNSGGFKYRSGVARYSSALAEAVRFQSIADTIKFIEPNGRTGDTLSIVRVEEIVTVQPETREVVWENTCLVLSASETIKYAVRYGKDTFNFATQYADKGTLGWGRVLKEATLFDTQGQAIQAIERNAANKMGAVLGSEGNIVRVRVTGGTSSVTFKETVLS